MSESSGNYSCSYSVARQGKMSINIYELNQQVYTRYFDNIYYNGSPKSNFISNLNRNWGGGNLVSSQSDNVGIIYDFYYYPSSIQDLQILVEADNTSTLYSSDRNVTIQSETSSLIPVEQRRLYQTQIRYAEYDGQAYLKVSQSENFGAFVSISSSHLNYPKTRVSVFDLIIHCPNGFKAILQECLLHESLLEETASSSMVKNEITEIANSDECSASCKIEDNYVCTRNPSISRDLCGQCTSGFYQNSQKNHCITQCGDGLKAGIESCDDGNALSSDDCDLNCSIEEDSICNGGSIISQDVCGVCIAGTSRNKNLISHICENFCLNKYRAKEEECDDENTKLGDGCNNKCGIEDKWACNETEYGNPDNCYRKGRDKKSYFFSKATTKSDIRSSWRKINEWFDYEQPNDELLLAGVENGSALLNLSGNIFFQVTFGIFLYNFFFLETY
ncbi:unnamed protein product [Moneuplotes crassus]|uniref:Uncharacterized protein n=1 Tax=Euplotes crassus TaxID=5936 RepID=A0AAD1XQZ7_EUPCR|nr:unnamed protein product [Moneuplotes crassus]